MCPTTACSNDYQNYVERGVRQPIQRKDVTLFEKRLKLPAGRVGQLFDYSSRGNDVGVDAKTIRSWLSILEALCFLLGIRKLERNTRQALHAVGQPLHN